MTVSWTPFAARRFIRLELVRLRHEAGFDSQGAASAASGVGRSNLAQLERGRHLPTDEVLPKLLDAYGEPGLLETLTEALRVARNDDRWAQVESVGISGIDLMLSHEDGACKIRKWEALCVPGLLQTEEYAFSLAVEAAPASSEAHIAASVRQRMARQALLTREEPAAPKVSFIVHEGALRLRVGGARVMGEQLAKVAKAAELPNVRFLVLPADTGAHAGMHGSFTVFTYPTPLAPHVVWTEDAAAGHLYEKPGVVETFTEVYESLIERSLGRERSIEKVEQIREEVMRE